MSRIICTATPKVKKSRIRPRQSARFGQGILAYRPTYYADHTAADEQWYVEQLALQASNEPDWDAMAAEAAAQDAYDRGLVFA